MPKKPVESRIQDIVYNIDTGLGLRIAQGAAAVLVLAVVILGVTATQWRSLDNAEAMDYAQLGRNLLLRRQYVTQFVRPVSMARVRERTGDPQVLQHPDLFHPPVYPTLLAGTFAISRAALEHEPGPAFQPYRPEQIMIVPLNHLFVVLGGVLLLLLGLRLFDVRVALISGLVYFLSFTVWAGSLRATGLPVLTFLVLACSYSLLRACEPPPDAPPLRRLFPLAVSAVLCGLAVLTRYAAIVLLPGALLYLGLALPRRCVATMALYAAIALAVVAPWLVRNARISGHPFGLAHVTAYHDLEGAMAEDMVERVPDGRPRASLRALQSKWFRLVGRFYREDLPALGDGLLFPFFLASLFFRFARRPTRLFRWAALSAMILLVLLAGFFGERTFRLVEAFWPIAILYGMAFFFLLLDRLRLGIRLFNFGVATLFVGLSVLPLALAVMPPRAAPPYPPYYWPFAVHVTRMLEPHEVIGTDMPWATAWYGNRASILLPRTLDDFYAIHDYQQRFSALYFTTLTRDRPYVRTLRTGENFRTWFPILEGRMPGDFPLTQGFPLNNLDQLFLTDRPRWPAAPPAAP